MQLQLPCTAQRLGFVLTEPARTRLHLPASYSSAHYVLPESRSGRSQHWCTTEAVQEPVQIKHSWRSTINNLGTQASLNTVVQMSLYHVFQYIWLYSWVIKAFSTTQVCQPFLTRLHNKEQIDVIAWLGAKSDETDSVKVAMGAGNEF